MSETVITRIVDSVLDVIELRRLSEGVLLRSDIEGAVRAAWPQLVPSSPPPKCRPGDVYWFDGPVVSPKDIERVTDEFIRIMHGGAR